MKTLVNKILLLLKLLYLSKVSNSNLKISGEYGVILFMFRQDDILALRASSLFT